MMPKNGIYILQGEANHVVAALRRSNRWSGGQFHQDDDQDPLLNSFAQLKETLQNTEDLNDLDVNVFLGPFLEVIRSEDTTGPITGVALSSVNKFLSYGLLDPSCESASSGIENLADAVTHARFVGTDPSSDEVVLMKILQVLRTLLLSPVGVHMTNESVCEIMQSCFRICFEMRLSELLRKTAEQTLIDMVQLLFLRLPQFKEDMKGVLSAPHIRKMFKRSGPLSSNRRTGKKSSRSGSRQNLASKQTSSSAHKAQVEKQDVSPDKYISHSDQEPVHDIPMPKMDAGAKSLSDSEEPSTTSPPIHSPAKQGKTKQLRRGHDSLLEEPETQKMASIGDNLNELGDESATDPSSSTLAHIDPAKMKSLEEGMDTIGLDVEVVKEDDACSDVEVDKVGEIMREVQLEEMKEVDTSLIPEEQDSKDELEISGFQNGGVISLHYPEDDARSLDSESLALDLSKPATEEVDGSLSQSSPSELTPQSDDTTPDAVENADNNEYINPQGVRFMPQETVKEGHGALIPYGLPCVRELLRFLTTLINPNDRHNTNTMIHIGLSLLTVALESGAGQIGHFQTLMNLVKDDMAKNLFALLQCDIHILFSLSMRVCFLLFEALRPYLKYQLEHFFVKLLEILSLDNINVPYEKREMALEYINQMFHIRFLMQELYVNFDCDLHSNNMFEDICKVLSKNAFRPGNLSSVNLLSLEALLTIVNEIEAHCHPPKRSLTESSCTTQSCLDEKEGARTISFSSDKTLDEDGDQELIDDLGQAGLATSGYAVAQKLLTLGLGGINKQKIEDAKHERALSDVSLLFAPSVEELLDKKKKKKLMWQGTEEFNAKPKKGIAFLQEHNLFSSPLSPTEMAAFFRDNPKVDKKIIGEYIGNRANPTILEAYVRSFEMKNVRIDEALRSFLEAFRLPGEAPVISNILESFSAVYFESNPSIYKNTDSAFTLAYAIIMLNVDQHNTNVKHGPSKSMNVDQFKNNLRGTNGGENFPPELLEEIFDTIKNNEIVMPSERVGRVKEAYEWKVLLQKAAVEGLKYMHVDSSLYDEQLFLVAWGPTVAALSYIYDNSNDKANVQKALQGFKRCATISADYNLSEVFDNLLISMCKFTSLLVTGEPSDNLPVNFGSNIRSQLSVRTVFALAHKHGDILREGWQNLLVCILQLLKAKMLPESLTEVEDFVALQGKISLIREEPLPVPKQDNAGLFSSFYMYILANPDTSSKAVQSPEDRQAQEAGIKCIKDCKPELLITESKFLRAESLQELVKALIIASKPEHSYESTDVPYDEDASVFFLEFLIKIALQNKDRISLLWQPVRDHLSNIVISAPKYSFLVERGVVGLLRLANRLIRREDISGQVLITLRILLMMHPKVLLSCGKQISYGLHELIRNNVSYIVYSRDWITVLTLLEVVGAGSSPPIVKPGPSLTMISKDLYTATSQEMKVEPETGEMYQDHSPSTSCEYDVDGVEHNTSNGEQWLLINKNEDEDIPVNQYDLALKEKLHKHDCRVFIKSSKSLGFIIRDMAHVSGRNIFQCIHALLQFGEACTDGGLKHRIAEPKFLTAEQTAAPEKQAKKKHRTKVKAASSPKTSKRSTGTSEDEIEINESTSDGYDAISLQLLDLMYTVHTNASTILGNMDWQAYGESQKAEIKARWSSKESIDQLPSTFRGDPDIDMSLLWVKCWCPLLQGIARLCCDVRREIRMSALTVLQRALLSPDMQGLTAAEWESCFNKVLFPMLGRLLEINTDQDPIGLEETRMRAATLLCKGFLQRLNTLIGLSTFTALWMTILDFMDKYMHADNSDLLVEAIPESLKNMLLVMSTAGIFEHHDDTKLAEAASQPQHLQADKNSRHYSALWQVTWDRIDCFLPHLKEELISTRPSVSPPVEPEPMQIPERPSVRSNTIDAKDNTAVVSSTSTTEPPSVVATSTVSAQSPVSQSSQSSVSPASPEISLPQKEPVESAGDNEEGPKPENGTPVKDTSARAASPLICNETPSMNITLHTPLPSVSPLGLIPVPPDSSPAPFHPIPILLPTLPSLDVSSDFLQSSGSIQSTSLNEPLATEALSAGANPLTQSTASTVELNTSLDLTEPSSQSELSETKKGDVSIVYDI